MNLNSIIWVGRNSCKQVRVKLDGVKLKLGHRSCKLNLCSQVKDITVMVMVQVERASCNSVPGLPPTALINILLSIAYAKRH